MELEKVDELLDKVHNEEQKLQETEQKLRKVGEKYNVNFDSNEDERRHEEAV